jgi:hypothetical protein
LTLGPDFDHQPCTNPYQKTCNQPVIIMYHKQVHKPCTNLYLNLYHKQVHQPCNKPVQITCQNNLSKQPITTTCLIYLINQIISTHQDQSPRQLSTVCTISPRCASTRTTHKHQQDVPQSRCSSKNIPIHIFHIIYKPCDNNTKCLQSCNKYVPSMHQI